MCSFARFFRSLLFALVLSHEIAEEKEEREREKAIFLSPHEFSPLLKHTLSLPVCSSSLILLLSSSLASFLVHFPLENMPRSHFFVRRSVLFLPQRCLFSHPRDGPIFFSCSSYHEQSLTSASNASCRRTSSTDSCLLPVCIRVYISIRRHLLSAFS